MHLQWDYGYGFSAIWVINSLELGMFFRRTHFFIIIGKTDKAGKALNDSFNICLNKETKKKACLKQGIDLGSSHK